MDRYLRSINDSPATSGGHNQETMSMIRKKHFFSTALPLASAFLLEGCLSPTTDKGQGSAEANQLVYSASVTLGWRHFNDYQAFGIGAGARDSVYIIGGNPLSPGTFSYYFWGPGFAPTAGTAFELDVSKNVGSAGSVWVIGSDYKIYESHDHGASWNAKGNRTFSEIGANSNSTAVWALGSGYYPGTSDHPIFKWNNSTSDWDSVGGAANRIEVGPDGTPWVVNWNRDIYHGNASGSYFGKYTSQKATDIGVGANGTIWILSNTNIGDGDKTLLKRVGSNWELANGGGTRITVNGDGYPVLVNSVGQVWEGLP